MRNHQALIGKDVGQVTPCKGCNLVKSLRKIPLKVLINLNLYLPYYTAIQLPGLFLTDLCPTIHQKTLIRIFIATFIAIAKSGNHKYKWSKVEWDTTQ